MYPARVLAAYHPALDVQDFSTLAASCGRRLIPAAVELGAKTLLKSSSMNNTSLFIIILLSSIYDDL